MLKISVLDFYLFALNITLSEYEIKLIFDVHRTARLPATLQL